MDTAKERFAGANELALSVDAFETGYSDLAEAVTKYTLFFKSTNKRTKYVLAPRLLLGLIEDDGRFDMLRLFLKRPEGWSARRKDFEGVLLRALKANYQRLLASDLYSEAVALEHGRNAIAVFRWLGLSTSIYPELPKVLPLKPKNPKGSRKAADVEPPFSPMSVEEIGSVLGDRFRDDLLAYEANELRGTTKIVGFRYLMSYVTSKPSSYSDAVVRALSGCGNEHCDATTIKSVIDECETALKGSGAFATKTVTGLMRNCSHLFEHMSELPNRSYPHFSRRYKKFTHVPTESASIADLGFPETKNLTGSAKLRVSMKVISDAAMDVLQKHASFFKAAEPLRKGRIAADLPKEERAACNAISAVVRAEIRSFEQAGKSQFSKSGVRTNSKAVDASMNLLADPATWREAGLGELVPKVASLDFPQIMTLVLCCVGATIVPVLAAKMVFCCDTGWNRQPIEDIPPEVYQFRLVDEVGVACASFVQAFKNRAGHLVQTLLEHSQLRGLRATDAVAAWEEAEREQNWGDCDQRSMVGYTSPAYVALELLRPSVEALDGYTKDQRVHERFFKSISVSGGVSLNKREIATVFKSGPLATPGLNFKLIRRSYLQLMFRVVDTVEALRTDAGHAGTGVLLPVYLNSPEIRRELEQSTRFFQNAIQSLVIAEVGKPLEFLMTPEQHVWFYNLARVSGVASAVGYGVSTPIAGPPAFRFTPSDEQLRSLFAISKSLDIEEKTADPRRWSLVGVPLRGFTKAIFAKLKSAGMSRLLKRISDEFNDDLRRGFVDLPPLNLSGAFK
ncbi:hypothetical protein [Rhizobium sp. CCGE 510]|uniref:hypothetical protein n=1 Tax=Rhizobium sp. CCGE 510 TaxID=1132836 RepID=UPI00027B8E26|nr:hypothetical protein [Rhizobium sp. CCGE 510]EJT05016.1 hypothetical protein RCCGE510_11174 [Rhizobium sp. CCGE 510]